MIVAGSGIYDRCCDCGKLVKLNKWLFGALHVCLSDEEIKEQNTARQAINNQKRIIPTGLGILIVIPSNNLGEKDAQY